MPYIQPERRKIIDQALEPVVVEKAGDLSYIIVKLCDRFLEGTMQYIVERNYDRYSQLIGVLTCTLLEYYRRRLVPYEEVKIKENGDV